MICRGKPPVMPNTHVVFFGQEIVDVGVIPFFLSVFQSSANVTVHVSPRYCWLPKRPPRSGGNGRRAALIFNICCRPPKMKSLYLTSSPFAIVR